MFLMHQQGDRSNWVMCCLELGVRVMADRWPPLARTKRGADDARDRLARDFGEAVFVSAVVDLDSTASVRSTVCDVFERGLKIDYLLLNAGLISGSDKVATDEQIEETFAPLIGHHQLALGLLENGLLSDSARILIAGSEAARATCR